ncbi:MAG: hypothetical protein OQJ95_05080 [Kangiella sp.]|nr:hypothetical protein [Kangiella sp.]MCW9027594.1 hypothetical protein [Kangiella sp.]
MIGLTLHKHSEKAIEVSFKELTGKEELGLAKFGGTEMDEMYWLLEQIITDISSNDERLKLDELTLSDFDLCVSHLYEQLYGSRVNCEVNCQFCSDGFEFDIELSDFKKTIFLDQKNYSRNKNGDYISNKGEEVFTLPKVSDLKNLKECPAESWLKQFLQQGECHYEQLQEHIETAGPLMSQDISADCPNCGESNLVRFDLTRYCLQSLKEEQKFLLKEVHIIANKYGWGLDQILSLTRSVRRQFAGFIIADNKVLRAYS